jgi:hypothetical protein
MYLKGHILLRTTRTNLIKYLSPGENLSPEITEYTSLSCRDVALQVVPGDELVRIALEFLATKLNQNVMIVVNKEAVV